MRQHWVPKFQLEHFAIQAIPGSSQINCLRMEDGSSFTANVKNVACKKHLYTISSPSMPLVIEKRLSAIEGIHAPYLDRWGKPPEMRPDERRALAGLFAAQYMRTPRMLAWWDELFEIMKKCFEMAQLFDRGHEDNLLSLAAEDLATLLGAPSDSLSVDEWKFVAGLSPEKIHDYAVMQVINRGKNIIETIVGRPWAFLHSPMAEFVTADEPIRVGAYNKTKVSLEDTESVAYWPITSTCALVIGAFTLRDGASYTITGFEGRLNQWLSTGAAMLFTGLDVEAVKEGIAPHMGEGLPDFVEIVSTIVP